MISAGLYPAARSASAPPSTPTSTGRKSEMYFFSDFSCALVSADAGDQQHLPVGRARC